MFRTSCDVWHLGLNRTDNKKLTPADFFYKSRPQIRHEDFNVVFKGKKLTQQYAVDQWVKVEAGRLDWVRRNQKTLRAEKYQGLLDAVQAGDVSGVGVKVILSSTTYGSPRFYSEAFRDAMAIVRHLGKPDIFITFTWAAIPSGLKSYELSTLKNKLATDLICLAKYSSRNLMQLWMIF
ncbi:hypothetical protein ElyMa_006198600 [Elysia marginata]|uniref:Helitron helicase-like domain-containing protein n=1 Tax=Elysia marginata TaxID=1093978 RepID=A0AAV4H2D0_9GAST|nr:hypothetical protein ElyMa_006198600 [Elysia marginata]